MDKRIELHYKLVEILGSGKVYFQPPASVSLSYPCIVYKRSSQKDHRANNTLYHTRKRYSITVIDKDPDSKIPDKMMELPYCEFDRHFATDGLNHDVYKLYY